jgi:2-polyprenyl-6-hydroxyphenyl methylase/3-demethylubiquinone-9 3-methyltransferase
MLNKSELQPIPNGNTDNALSGNFSTSEIAKFDQLADSWWDPKGKYKTALEFNRVRVDYFIAEICQFYSRDPSGEMPLKDLHILDLGCGGGLVCEALAKAGADVVGIDVSEMSIEVAKRHAMKSQLSIEYRHEHAQQTVEKDKGRYDVVINAEVIEHVPDQQTLINQCSKLVKDNGFVIMATLNRTIKSYLIGIIGAEYIMRYLPVGTHSWKAFVKPKEIIEMADKLDMQCIGEIGMVFNIWSKKWRVTSDIDVNYIQVYHKLPVCS